jgi:hypothetical protein
VLPSSITSEPIPRFAIIIDVFGWMGSGETSPVAVIAAWHGRQTNAPTSDPANFNEKANLRGWIRRTTLIENSPGS